MLQRLFDALVAAGIGALGVVLVAVAFGHLTARIPVAPGITAPGPVIAFADHETGFAMHIAAKPPTRLAAPPPHARIADPVPPARIAVPQAQHARIAAPALHARIAASAPNARIAASALPGRIAVPHARIAASALPGRIAVPVRPARIVALVLHARIAALPPPSLVAAPTPPGPVAAPRRPNTTSTRVAASARLRPQRPQRPQRPTRFVVPLGFDVRPTLLDAVAAQPVPLDVLDRGIRFRGRTLAPPAWTPGP